MKKRKISEGFRTLLSKRKSVKETVNKKDFFKIEGSRWSETENFGFPVPLGYSSEEEKRKDDLAAKAWNTFLEGNPPESEWKNENKLKKIIRTYGIPKKLRPFVWMKLSGGFDKRFKNKGYYASILKTHDDFPAKRAEMDIDLDLHRTFPCHPFFGKEGPALQKMKRILMAYSWRNPLVSYVQCFNYIVGSLLLIFQNEEDSFFMFVQIVEEILPDNYYDQYLKGARVDSLTFNALLSIYNPEVSIFFQKNNVDAGNIFTTPWMMSLFITCLPMTEFVRIWDCFFLEGPIILFRVCLAMFKLFEDKILKASLASIFDLLKGFPKESIDIAEILRIGFSYKSMKNIYIDELRGKYEVDIDKEIEASLEKKLKRMQIQVEKFTSSFVGLSENKGKRKRYNGGYYIPEPTRKFGKKKRVNYVMEEAEESEKSFFDPLLGKEIILKKKSEEKSDISEDFDMNDEVVRNIVEKYTNNDEDDSKVRELSEEVLEFSDIMEEQLFSIKMAITKMNRVKIKIETKL